MTTRRTISNTFHRIGDTYNHYFNPDHFMGQDALTDMWDARHDNIPVTVKPDFKLSVKLPGFEENEIKVNAKKGKLRVQASMAVSTTEDVKDEYLVQELHLETFDETFTLPENLNTEKLFTSYDGKTLKISIPYLSK